MDRPIVDITGKRAERMKEGGKRRGIKMTRQISC
jgi:hypothetical protein